MNPPPDRFTVEVVGQAGPHIDRLARCAEQRGLQPLLVEVLRDLAENLETRPREWGDPYKNYRTLSAVGYGRTILPARIRVEYAVHNTQPLVWVSAVRPLLGSPFEGA